MAVQSADAVPILQEIGRANWWHVAELRIVTPASGGLRVDVVLQSRLVDADRVTVLQEAADRVIHLEGQPLGAAMADALRRSKTAAEAEGANASQALFVGMRDAVYAALVAGGVIPAAAVTV